MLIRKNIIILARTIYTQQERYCDMYIFEHSPIHSDNVAPILVRNRRLNCYSQTMERFKNYVELNKHALTNLSVDELAILSQTNQQFIGSKRSVHNPIYARKHCPLFVTTNSVNESRKRCSIQNGS
jgi:hypothetical protein